MENNILLDQLKKFYENEKNLNTLFKILNHNNIFKKSKEKKISLRLIDWFVTNYCKKNKVIIEKTIKNKKEFINIYNSYKSNLRAFSKQLFDPFRRKKQIFLYYHKRKNLIISFCLTKKQSHQNFIKTTIGQINFFKWIIENNIYNYIKLNKKIIESDMISSQKENNNKKLDKKNLVIKTIKSKNGSVQKISRKKRIELSKSVNKNMQFNKQHTILYFD
mgnify:CR=1 FL=1|tara:strand:+ start:2242 stop:2898 length:657 start_codon:yes stop_codon:yes gene_type:complete